MSFPKDLDEYLEEELMIELQRREHLRREGRCDYCKSFIYFGWDGKPSAPCKFPERHKDFRK